MPTKKTTTTTTRSSTAAKKPTARKSGASTTRARNGNGASGEESTARRGRRNGLHDLVIVESPAKARTIAGILGPGYEVTASVGHVRDLPKSKLGVDVNNGFEPHYIVPKEKKEVVAKIKEAAAKAQSVFLATDPDRE